MTNHYSYRKDYNSDAVEPPRHYVAVWRRSSAGYDIGADYYYDPDTRVIVECYRWTDGNGFDEQEARDVWRLAERVIDHGREKSPDIESE